MSAYDLACRLASRWGFSSGLLHKLVLAVLLSLMLPAAADAYTLVLRSGRHVTVPDAFKVTQAAVIYEASPGFTVTVWLSNVDFAATESANGEPAGSFAKRVVREPEGAVAAPAQVPLSLKEGRRSNRRVVTNRELEPFRQRREAQEEEYERTRRERGMPSKQEWRRRVEEQDRRLSELARQMEEERREAEVESLRAELAETRRELNDLGLRLSQQSAGYVQAYVPPSYYPYSYAQPFQFVTVLPFGHRRRSGHWGFGPWRSQQPWPGRPFPTAGGPRWNAVTLPQMRASAPPARWR